MQRLMTVLSSVDTNLNVTKQLSRADERKLFKYINAVADATQACMAQYNDDPQELQIQLELDLFNLYYEKCRQPLFDNITDLFRVFI